MFNGKENYFKSADNGHKLSASRSRSKYFQEVIKVIGKDKDNNDIYLKFVEQKDGRQHPGYAVSTIIKGFGYGELMNYLNYRNNLNSMVCICETGEYLTNGYQNKVGPVETLKYLKKNFNELKSMGLITSQKDFIMTPVYNGEFNKGHWTVAIISQDRIDMFDSTLQQKNTFEINNKLLKCNETVNAKRQIQNENGKICGLCSAEFIIEASKCDSLEHLKENINTICDKVAANVIKAIGSENAKEQLTEDFQNRVYIQIEKNKRIQNNPFPGLELTSDLKTNIQYPVIYNINCNRICLEHNHNPLVVFNDVLCQDIIILYK